VQADTVYARVIRGRGESPGAEAEELDGRIEVLEQLAPERGSGSRLGGQRHLSVHRTNVDPQAGVRLADLESGDVIRARENAVADSPGDAGAGLASRHVDADVAAVSVIPLDRKPMSEVLARETGCMRQAGGADAAHADEADASYGMATDELRSEGTGQERSHALGVDPVIDKQPALNETVNAPGDHGAGSSVSGAGASLRERRRRSTICSGQTADRKLPTQTASRSGTREYKMRFASRRSVTSPAARRTPR
jgi:hypothetical protein